MNALQAIETKKLGATNTRGSRIIAKTASGVKLTIGYPYELSGVDCHAKAAEALARNLKWIEPDAAFDGKYVAGATSSGYVFVDRG
jgi:hypothetical protein